MEPEHVTSIKEEYFILIIGMSTLISSICPPAAYVMSFVNGAGQTIFFNITDSRTQFLSPSSMRGRTISLYTMIISNRCIHHKPAQETPSSLKWKGMRCFLLSNEITFQSSFDDNSGIIPVSCSSPMLDRPVMCRSLPLPLRAV
jgi:hypothetical protein